MNEYSKAYSEVLEVIKYLPKKDYDKIPPKTINLLEQNCDESSDFTYNIALPFDKQELSKDAKLILAIIYRNCWITEEEKEKIRNYEKEKFIKQEQLKREKYNPDDLFKKKEKNIVKELKENNYLAEVNEEKWYTKIWNKIKNIFRKQ